MWGFLIIWFVLGPIGGLFALGAIPIAIYALLTRNPRRGVRAARTALVLSLLAVFASALLWATMFLGPPSDSDSDIGVYEVTVWFEAFALATALLSVLRQRLRGNAPPRATP
jgi:hypothetical protein